MTVFVSCSRILLVSQTPSSPLPKYWHPPGARWQPLASCYRQSVNISAPPRPPQGHAHRKLASLLARLPTFGASRAAYTPAYTYACIYNHIQTYACVYIRLHVQSYTNTRYIRNSHMDPPHYEWDAPHSEEATPCGSLSDATEHLTGPRSLSLRRIVGVTSHSFSIGILHPWFAISTRATPSSR